ncbi:MAG: DUF1028 domain-containing protein [Ilumatobacteraceae bacterium]
MTFTIVAGDRAAGSIGLASISHSRALLSKTLAVNAWSNADALVASQAFSSRAIGEAAIADLATGVAPSAAGRDALAADPRAAARQLLVVSADGVGAFTGDWCLDASQLVHDAEGYAVGGNMLASPDVVAEMALAFESTPGSLPDRLLAAIAAGHAAGGDYRGDRSGGLVVRGPIETLELRVDDHPEPAEELGRLLQLTREQAVIGRCHRWLIDPDTADAHSLLAELEAALPSLGDTARLWQLAVSTLAGREVTDAETSAAGLGRPTVSDLVALGRRARQHREGHGAP